MGIPAQLSSIPAQTPYQQYVATNGQTVFPYNFEITQDSDLTVVYNGTTLNTDSGYSVSGVGNATGGNITFATGATVGDIVTIFRDIPISRLTQIAQNSGFSSAAFNNEFNNIYLLLQQLEASIAQCLQVPNTNYPAPTTTLLPANYAGKYLAFDSNGNPTPAVLTVNGTITQAVLAGLLFPQTQAEFNAGITPTNLAYQVPRPERYGAKGDGVTDDTEALQNCITANNTIELTGGTTYLTSGLTFSTTGGSIYGAGGSEARSVIKLVNASGNKALHFVSSSGNGTHFDTGFIGRDFAVTCQAGSAKMSGIYCDNAELQCLDNVVIDLSANTYAGGSAGDGTIAFYGYFQQDGVYLKSFFTGGSGAYGDGIYLTGSISGNATPNDNLFLGCRAQSCGGFGVRLICGDGNKWVGGKIQGNAQGGWTDATDGLGGGPANSMLLNTAFEANTGYDIFINISSGMRCSRVEFESTGVTAHISGTSFCTEAVFEDCQSTSGKNATFTNNTGTANKWARTNRGFGTVALVGFNDLDGGTIALTYSASIAVDATIGRFFVIVASDTNAFTINNPANPQSGQIIAFDIKNFSGGSMGTIAWGSAFKLAGAFSNPANNNHRTIVFMYDSAAWREISRAAADISS